MNLKLRELSRTILKLDSGGSLESLYTNYSACLRHLTGYLSQKDDSERKALLAVLRNMAFNKHQDLGRSVDEASIAREMKDTFRRLLLQVLKLPPKRILIRSMKQSRRVRSNSGSFNQRSKLAFNHEALASSDRTAKIGILATDLEAFRNLAFM
jgi:hypothetical protein